jgi:hypothetical protein
MMNGVEDVKARYRQFAEVECKGYSDLYYRLAHAVADYDELASFIVGMPAIQPNLFFASVQFLSGPDAMPASGPELCRFVRRRGGDVARLMRSRRTQTNEVGRCAVLLPALPRGPLALVEVGASAGLCLLMDRFWYDYGGVQIGVESSPVHLRCTVTRPVPLPATLPAITWRGGLDIAPVDVNDDDATRWLLSCVWADHHDRRQRLAAAIGLSRANPVAVRRGDLVADLPDLLAQVPPEATLVVLHSAVLAYVSREDRRAFARALAEEASRRELVWISNEGPGVVAEFTNAPVPTRGETRFLLGRTRFTRSDRSDELLALAHPHGAELQWLMPPASPVLPHPTG